MIEEVEPETCFIAGCRSLILHENFLLGVFPPQHSAQRPSGLLLLLLLAPIKTHRIAQERHRWILESVSNSPANSDACRAEERGLERFYT